jgi:hypothetical protein
LQIEFHNLLETFSRVSWVRAWFNDSIVG